MYWAVVWWNQIIHNIRQDTFQCCDFFYIACTFREAILSVLTDGLLSDARWQVQIRETRWSRAVAAITRHSERLDLSLVAFFWKTKSCYGVSTKALNVAKLATLRAPLLLTSFSLSDCSSTRDAFVNAHTHIQEYLDHGQSEGGPPFTISDWFRPRYKPNGSVFCWVSESRILFFSFLEWLDAPVRPGIFVSRTREKLGRTCDQIGRTLEPWGLCL